MIENFSLGSIKIFRGPHQPDYSTSVTAFHLESLGHAWTRCESFLLNRAHVSQISILEYECIFDPSPSGHKY